MISGCNPTKQNERRLKVIARLEQQLKDGTKGKNKDEKIPLNDEDKERISNQLEVLKSRLINDTREV